MIEFKRAGHKESEDLDVLAKQAVVQIDANLYLKEV
jgi:hypothetical protein